MSSPHLCTKIFVDGAVTILESGVRPQAVARRFRAGAHCLALAGVLLSGLAPQAPACTSVCITARGCVVFGNTLDWFVDDGLVVANKRGVKKSGLWFDNPPEWTSRYASLTVNQDGREFPSRGMNEAGLVIGEMTLTASAYPERDSRHPLSGNQWIQYQLDNCATVAEVIATDGVIRIDRDEYHSHYFVCDASGGCAVMEWLDGKLSAHTGPQLPVKALANDTYERSLAARAGSQTRFAKAAALLDAYASEDPITYVFDILEAVHQPSTVWRLVFDVTNRRLHYLTAQNPASRSIGLSEFDGSCGAEVEVLDVNALGEGSVRGRFSPFSAEANAALSRATFRKLEPRFGPFGEDFLQKVINYSATTVCVDPSMGARRTRRNREPSRGQGRS